MCTLTMFTPNEILNSAMDALSKEDLTEYYRLYKIYKEMTEHRLT